MSLTDKLKQQTRTDGDGGICGLVSLIFIVSVLVIIILR